MMYWHISAKPFYLENLSNYSMRIRKSVRLCLAKSSKFWVRLHYPHPPYFMSCGGKKSAGCMHLSTVLYKTEITIWKWLLYRNKISIWKYFKVQMTKDMVENWSYSIRIWLQYKTEITTWKYDYCTEIRFQYENMTPVQNWNHNMKIWLLYKTEITTWKYDYSTKLKLQHENMTTVQNWNFNMKIWLLYRTEITIWK